MKNKQAANEMQTTDRQYNQRAQLLQTVALTAKHPLY